MIAKIDKQIMTNVAILLGLSALSKRTSQNTESSHPQHLERHMSIGSHVSLVTRLGVDHIVGHNQLANVLSAVGTGSLGRLVGANLDHGGSQSLLIIRQTIL